MRAWARIGTIKGGAVSALLIAVLVAAAMSGATAASAAPAGHSPRLHLDSHIGQYSVLKTAFVVDLAGWTFDQDAPSARLTVTVWEGTQKVVAGITNQARADVDKAFKISGTHGFALTFKTTSKQTHTYCVVTTNVRGGVNAKACFKVAVAGDVAPIGQLETATTVNGVPTLSGWAFDANEPSWGPAVSVIVPNSNQGAFGSAGIVRADINKRYGLTGAHGFSLRLLGLVADGDTTFCLVVRNVGPTLISLDQAENCLTAHVHNSPYGAVTVTPTATGIHIEGWAVDPNAPTAAVTVQPMIDGVRSDPVVADLPSEDIDAANGLQGAHGFSADLPEPPGDYGVFIFLENIGLGSGNADFYPWQTITVP